MTNETFRTWWKLFRQRWDRADQRELAAFYWSELKRMDDAAFERAARHALRSLSFFPTVEQLERAGGLSTGDPAEQWEKVLPLLRNASSPLDTLDEPARRAVRAMGGLAAIGQDEKALPFRRSEFFDLYERYGGDAGAELPAITQDGRKLIEQAMGAGR